MAPSIAFVTLMVVIVENYAGRSLRGVSDADSENESLVSRIVSNSTISERQLNTDTMTEDEVLLELDYDLQNVLHKIRARLDDVQSGNLNPRYCEKKDSFGRPECDTEFACTSNAAKHAQQGTYWMPCGALTIKKKNGAKGRRLCPTRNIIRTRYECMEAAEQFEDEWAAKLQSGFSRSDSTSDLKFRGWFNDLDSWKVVGGWTDAGFKPVFRSNAWIDGKSTAPLGCSLDVNQNMIYWNPYKMDKPEEWQNNAEYTELNGLIHEDSKNDKSWLINQVGICKGN